LERPRVAASHAPQRRPPASAQWRAHAELAPARAGLAVAFVAPIAGVMFIVEQSAANLGEAVYWRALLAASAAVLALNILAAAYSDGPGFWDARCARGRAPGRRASPRAARDALARRRR